MSSVSMRMSLQEEVSSKLQKISNSGKSLSTQLASLGRQIDAAFTSASPEAFAQKVGAAADAAVSDIGEIGRAAADINNDISNIGNAANVDTSGIEDLADSAEQAEKVISETTESTKKFSETLGGLGDGTDGIGPLTEQVDDAGNSMDAASEKAISFGGALKTLFAVVSAAAIIGQVKDFASDSISLGKDYTSMMSEVQSLSGATGSDLALLENTAREYGATTVFSATESAEALKYMSLAGWSAQQSASALGGVLNLAASGGMELGQASDMVTDYLSAFGMEAQDSAYFADMLAYAQANSNTTAAQLGEAYKNSAANLHAAGQDVETTTSLLEAMANQGRKGSEAGTSLAAVMRDITAKMDDGAIKIGDTSVAVQDASGNFRDLTDILTDVESATDGMGNAQRAAALSATFTDDSIKAVNMVLNEGMDKVAGYEEALRGSTGAAQEMSDTMNDNLAGDMANMNSAFEEMQLQTYEAMEEPLRNLAQFTTDSVIPALTGWVPDAFGSLVDGATKLGKAISPMIETVLKNPKAVGDAFLSIGAGFAAMKTVNTGFSIAKKVTEAGGVVDYLGSFANKLFGSPWAAGAAAAVAAITAVGLAIKEYNDIQVEDSLNAHFGSVELDDSQIEDFASRIINAEWLVNINAALGHFDNAEELAQQAEDALKQNDTLEWRARVGISLTEDEQSTYMSNIETFTTNIEQALSEQTLAAKMTVNEFDIKMADGSSLGSQIEKWAEQDLGQMQYLSSGLTNLVQNALEDGIIDVDEQAAIDQLQDKINNIMEGWQEAEAQAQMDVLTQKYGRLSGKDLEPSTFVKVVEELGKQRETATAALETSEKKLYTTLNALNRADENGVQRISDDELTNYKQQAGYAVRNNQASMIGNSLEFEKNTISDAYGEKLDSNYSAIQEQTGNFLNNANSYLENQDYKSLFDSMQNGFISAMTGTNIFSGKDQQALSDIYDSMKPDVESMAGLIDEYKEMGQAVPQDVMTAFNDAVQVGAAAGDVDAAWQVFANQMIADPESEALVQAIQDGTVNVPDELRTAIERATAKTTTDPVTIEGMQADVDNIEINEAHVQELIDTAFEGLTYVGTTTLDGGEIALQYTVNEGDTLSGIMEQYGVVWSEVKDQIQAANPDIQDLNLILPDQVINIPESVIEIADVNTDQAKAEIQAAADEATQEPITEEQQVDTTITKGKTNTSAAKTLTEDEAKKTFTDPISAEGTVNAELTKGEDNISSVYSQVGSEVRSAFATPFPASATVNVSLTANYKLTNSSEKISFGGGATGEATVTASIAKHATGGIFDEPHFAIVSEAGPESIIPLDGSDHAVDLWQETGVRLGMFGGGKDTAAPLQISPVLDAEASSSGSGSESRKSVDININGSGRITAGGGISKADVVNILMERVRDVIVDIIEEEILVGGDAAYEY